MAEEEHRRAEQPPRASPQRRRRRRDRRMELDEDEWLWESNKEKSSSYRGPTLNWRALAERKWAKDPPTKYLPHPEVANLIGWAHHGTHNGSARADWEEDDDDDGDDQPPQAKRHLPINPQLQVDDTGPLPLSCLTYLQDKASELMQRQRTEAKAAAATADGSNDGKKKRKTTKRIPSVATLPTIPQDCFDTSAAVALSVILEEMMTANLLPLAEQHVQRCKQLEKLEAKHQQSSESSSFHQWTLPPEEAIFNLMVSSLPSSESVSGTNSGRGHLPTARPPSRSVDKEVPRASGDEKGENDNKLDATVTAVNRWCQWQGHKPTFVRKNMDIFQWLLSAAPVSPLPAEAPKETNNINTSKKRKKQRRTATTAVSANAQQENKDAKDNTTTTATTT